MLPGRELLAINEAVTQLSSCIYGVRIQVRTDHWSLRWLVNFKELDGQMSCLSGLLRTYDYSFTYHPGIGHANADSLSRCPCRKCHYCGQVEVKNQK